MLSIRISAFEVVMLFTVRTIAGHIVSIFTWKCKVTRMG